jgi:hypothetical protein
MKLSITPVALAVTMALGAAVAQAQTPTYGTTSPTDGGSNDGLYLAVWDNNSGNTDMVDLSTLYAGIAASSGTLTTPTPGSNGWTQVSNFDGFATVDQINLGTISNFSSLFPASGQSAATQYAVVASNNTGTGVVATTAVGASNNITESAVKTLSSAILGQSAEWASASNTSPLGDTTGKATFSIPSGNGSLADGTLGIPADSFSAQVGTAANFFNYVTSSGRPATLTTTEYAYQSQDGFWFLSSTGDLSWNLVTTASTVPLPPAVWLFASGLIGLGLIGRRRQTGLGAAV